MEFGAQHPGQDGGRPSAPAPGPAELGGSGLRRRQLRPGPRAWGPRTDKDLRPAGSEWEQDGRFSGWWHQGLREVVRGPSLGLEKAEGEADFLAPGVSPWPLSVGFLFEATGLNSQLIKGETDLLLSLLMLLPYERRWALGVTRSGIRVLCARCVTLGKSSHVSDPRFPLL